ncbi:bifunctional phosphopantothenoylcysteine decarboxylase/phosphopantothenate--cysteine ligase CoaBC [soil metagenome]
MSSPLIGKQIVLGLCGGIAAYKAAALCRELVKAGAEVQVVMTESAQRFITPTTMTALSGRPVATSQWSGDTAGDSAAMPHIHLLRRTGWTADAIVVAPCTGNFIGKLANGIADDLLSTLCLARSCPLVLAPAMNVEMWDNPALQRNVTTLLGDGVTILGPDVGAQACGENGAGRLLEPVELMARLAAFFTPARLAGLRVLVTAGPTYEAIDPVRGITNRSSGKMGYAIAQAAFEAGAHVELISGPTQLDTPVGVERLDVRSAAEMLTAVTQGVARADVFIAVAAVADWRVSAPADHKLKKADGRPTLDFVENVDILASVSAHAAAHGGKPFCVGFAAETEALGDNAAAKRIRKGIPLLVGNIGPDAFGADDNAVLLIDAHGETRLPATGRADKLDLARSLIAAIAQRKELQ